MTKELKASPKTQAAPKPANRLTVEQICYTDVFRHGAEGVYIVRSIHQQPVFAGKNPVPHWRLKGFTLFETTTLTDREVSCEEMQQQLDEGTIVPFQPEKARRLPW